MQQQKFKFEDMDFLSALMGCFDSNGKVIEELTKVSLVCRDDSLILIGEDTDLKRAWELIAELKKLYDDGQNLDARLIRYTAGSKKFSPGSFTGGASFTMPVNAKGVPIKPKTMGQREYLEAIERSDITLCIGPAGTGKTYLAVAMAYKLLKSGKIDRIILTRPAVEAGESLGFLPGDLKMKVDPYLRPLYDALFDMMGQDKFSDYIEKGVIEVAPLAFMRGRTLDNAFVILDEAQNTTSEQMKMFLTRLGFNSKAVVTGDLTQIDLPIKKSGLSQAASILKNIECITMIKLGREDVVRHALVQKIVDAYEKYEDANQNSQVKRHGCDKQLTAVK